ncbi:MAG: PhzF family phenazine biosynthesis isomerase [Bacteroidota bacterium]
MIYNAFSIYQVLGDKQLGYLGNTAAVVELPEKIGVERMQQMAADYNQPATSFIWENGGEWNIRWFAPDGEIGLCGHGSIAALSHLNNRYTVNKVKLSYNTGHISGEVHNFSHCSISLDAIQKEHQTAPEEALIEGLGVDIMAHYKTNNKNLVIVKDENTVKSMTPDFSRLKDCTDFGFIVTAPGDTVDFVSRTIIPHVKQLEDPATGSSHAVLTPYWADILKKKNMVGHQLSERGGKFICEINHNTVTLSGEFKLLAKGEVYLK